MSLSQHATAEEHAAVPRTGGVQSVDRALDVLEVLGSSDRPMGVSEIARLTALPQGTVHRLLLTLLGRGYARRDAERKYAVGAAALRLGDAANRGLVSIGEQYLRQLVQLTGETANLAVLEGAHMVYAAQSPSPHTLRIFAEVGRRVPIHATAVGKVALAGMDQAVATRLLEHTGLPPQTPSTITSLEAMLAELARVAEQGYAVDDEEQELGVRCVAVPVPSPHSLVAAVSVSGPVERFSLQRAESLVDGIRQIAAGLSAAVSGP